MVVHKINKFRFDGRVKKLTRTNKSPNECIQYKFVYICQTGRAENATQKHEHKRQSTHKKRDIKIVQWVQMVLHIMCI